MMSPDDWAKCLPLLVEINENNAHGIASRAERRARPLSDKVGDPLFDATLGSA